MRIVQLFNNFAILWHLYKIKFIIHIKSQWRKTILGYIMSSQCSSSYSMTCSCSEIKVPRFKKCTNVWHLVKFSSSINWAFVCFLVQKACILTHGKCLTRVRGNNSDALRLRTMVLHSNLRPKTPTDFSTIVATFWVKHKTLWKNFNQSSKIYKK